MEKFLEKIEKILKSKEFYKKIRKEIFLCLENGYTYEDKDDIISEVSSNLYNKFFKNFENEYNKLIKIKCNKKFPDNLFDLISILTKTPLESFLYSCYKYSIIASFSDDDDIICQACSKPVRKCVTIKYSLNNDEFDYKKGMSICEECAFKLKDIIDEVFKDENDIIKELLHSDVKIDF